MDLSKSDKRICRELIETGLQRELTRGLDEAESILCDWKSRNKDVKDMYYALYNKIRDFNKHIARRYDGISGSRYLSAVSVLLSDEIITKEECAPFSEEVRQVVFRMEGFNRSI